MDIFLGERPLIPTGTPQSIVTLIKSCWDAKPENRPTAAEIFNLLNA
ncbi:7768_t:CDS:1, partial [Acaulospora morrowiae]